MKQTTNELRCFCSRQPLLAVYGLDKYGKIYIHVKIWKAHRIFGEMLVVEGKVKLRCRDCLRWQQVVIKQPGKPSLLESSEPQELRTIHR